MTDPAAVTKCEWRVYTQGVTPLEMKMPSVYLVQFDTGTMGIKSTGESWSGVVAFRELPAPYVPQPEPPKCKWCGAVGDTQLGYGGIIECIRRDMCYREAATRRAAEDAVIAAAKEYRTEFPGNVKLFCEQARTLFLAVDALNEGATP